MSLTRHIVWDWNGTLFDDFDISVTAASAACVEVGGAPIEGEAYRRCFTRPVRTFYERLLERAVSDDQWHTIVDTYHSNYTRQIPLARLRHRAKEVLAELAASGVTHSLLSMGEHEEVVALVEQWGISESFLIAEGVRHHQGRTDSKQQALKEHLALLQGLSGTPLLPSQVVLIGDTLDDLEAANAAGTVCVLLDDGSYDPSLVGELGLTVANGLEAAAEAGLRLLPEVLPEGSSRT
ncbi:HAD family hydrolase [Streptomyces odontomachi]|uniref:HAD family hydrolase n=1 Tax=Streptomyces odontomachi TaxID=2944940 RepID=UPI00210AB0AA|nr:HAD hydrolase-like protein [Streptomyces sp. ODS25]